MDTKLSFEENPLVAKFEDFFQQVLRKNIDKLAESYPQKRSLDVDFKLLEKFDYELADELLENPDLVLEAASLAIEKINVPTLREQTFSPHIRFFSLSEDRTVLLRNIGAQHLEKLVTVEGIIKQITDVLPKLKVAAWKCKYCGNMYKVDQNKPELTQPAFCECRHRDFQLQVEESTFINYQKVGIQEPLELLKGNDQPTDLDVYLSDDMVNRVSAGDKIKIAGIIRLGGNKKGLVFGRYIESLHIEETEKEFEELEISEEEEKQIKELAQDTGIYSKLVSSIATGIYGHETVKEAIALQLFGGVKKALPGQQAIRGNIHILLVGDPGVGKSMLLLSANAIAPRSIYVGGKTASSAGLSATAVKDEFGEGGWTLKAGALVLASGGLANIDEMDKMDADDRGALHECLEQQSISVAKAGIITRFKTETSLLAAANPKFSRFDIYQPFLEQIDLPASLISRFDLFFMIKDVLDKTKDTEIAQYILKTHQSGERLLQAKTQGKELGAKELTEIKKLIVPAIDSDTFKKYVSYARQNIFPVLSKEAIQLISDFYVDLREKGKQDGHYAATHRQLEGLIRLSEASARVRLSDVVEIEDAERATRLFRLSLEETMTDPTTGKIDIDIVATGQSHSQLEQLKKVLQIIKDKAKEIDQVPLDLVLDQAESIGIDKDKAREIIKKLEKKGEIYRPRYNLIKPTQFNE
ncbi:MAG: minichromosome maintenance protein MCM [Candidatus Diapherotrites archaeon]|nr:minichromosome maintenance protein MCM [Candidatus Diapherotrites archaeon]